MLSRAVYLLLILNLLACPVRCASTACCQLRTDPSNTADCCTAHNGCHRSQPGNSTTHGDSTVPGPSQPVPCGQACQCVCQTGFWTATSVRWTPQRCEAAVQRSADHFTSSAVMLSHNEVLGEHHREHKPVNGRLVRCLLSSLLC